MLERWTRGVLRRRLLVLAAWLAVAASGIVAAAHLSPLLSNSLAVPGSESDRARRLLEEHYGERPDGTFTVVFPTRVPGSERLQEDVRERLRRAARVVPDGVASEPRRGGGVLYGDVVTPLALEDAKAYTTDVRSALAAPNGPEALVTGAPAIQHDLDPAVHDDLRRAELVALPVALLVLALVLGVSSALLIPFVFAACTIGGTLALLYPLAHALRMASYVENLVVLIGLALAIDYALLCVDRFRSELEQGGSRDDVVVRTMATTGRAVAFSAVAVAVGLGVLVLVPVPFVRSLGLGGALVPLVSVAALLTLQPVLLSLLASRVLVRGLYDRGTRSPANGVWASLAGARAPQEMAHGRGRSRPAARPRVTRRRPSDHTRVDPRASALRGGPRRRGAERRCRGGCGHPRPGRRRHGKAGRRHPRTRPRGRRAAGGHREPRSRGDGRRERRSTPLRGGGRAIRTRARRGPTRVRPPGRPGVRAAPA